MPKPAPAKWIQRLRAGCPRGWTVKNMRGKIYLSVRSGAGGTNATTTTLPLAWAADEVPAAIELISQLQQAVADGHDLKDALARIQNERQPSAVRTGMTRWPDLIEAFQRDVSANGRQIKQSTWNSNYAPYLTRLQELMATRAAPTNARELIEQVIQPWADRPRSRELAVNATGNLLDFGIDTDRLAAGTWTLSARDRKHFKGRKAPKKTKATLDDRQLLALIDSLPDNATGRRWQNALRLLALYGLRPEELKHLTAKEHPTTGEAALHCSYRKVCGDHLTEPRWLLPVSLIDAAGDEVKWNLAAAMRAGLLELPPMATKHALGTYLNRQPLWKQLRADADGRGEQLKPYVFRDSFSLRAHRRGLRVDLICAGMGHSLSTHQTSYVWADATTVLDAVAVTN